MALGWKNVKLSNGFVLSYHDKLNVWLDNSRNIVILGNVWQVDHKQKSPTDVVQGINLEDDFIDAIYEMEKTWCGRYVLIVKDWIFLDTIGSLGIFYNDMHISSSLNVLCTAENKKIIYPNIKHGEMPDFIPGMQTCYNGIKRLLPSQIYNIVTKEVRIRPLLPDGVISSKSDNDRIELLEHYFVHSLQNMGTLFNGKDIWLSLTGGRDSRAAMAFMERAGIKYKTFTCEYPGIKLADIDLARRLSRKARRKHLFVKREKTSYSQDRYDNYRVHTAGMAVDQDWNFYAYNQYQKLTKNNSEIVILRNSIWENVNDYYSQYCKDGNLNLERLFSSIKEDEFLKSSLLEWYNYVQHDDLNKNDLSIWNRMLWELRTGCWLSSIEQSFDMMDGITSIQPCNCRLFLSILAGFNQKDRSAKKHEEYIVERVCTKLSKIPYDYQYTYSVYMRFRRLLGNVCHMFVRN
ncbi:MAG: hypothetical protein J5725_03755 [Bacteroidales bacterium]|nr:hypothetical protein [Bacteroidales bacterium]